MTANEAHVYEEYTFTYINLRLDGLSNIVIL
jgi:hypothetical protein